MKPINILIKLGIASIILLLLGRPSIAQENYESHYDNYLGSTNRNSYGSLKKRVVKKNSFDFISMCYYLNANNIMYEATNEIRYLAYNYDLIKDIVIADGDYNINKNPWVIAVAASEQNAGSNGQESINFEGYFFRYVAEYLNIIKREGLFVSFQPKIQQSLENVFDKWEKVSLKRHGDYSMLYHTRMHIGANWAVVALYLSKFTKDSKYKTFYEAYNTQLKKALRIVKKDGQECYEWNQTYPEKFTKSIQALKNNPIMQDVSHGNHVVTYMITAYDLGLGGWKEADMKRLANTLKLIIYDKEKDKFADNVNGEFLKGGSFGNTGWKQSDGWMKLIRFDSDLLPIYQNYFEKQQTLLLRSDYYLQSAAILKYNDR